MQLARRVELAGGREDIRRAGEECVEGVAERGIKMRAGEAKKGVWVYGW